MQRQTADGFPLAPAIAFPERMQGINHRKIICQSLPQSAKLCGFYLMPAAANKKYFYHFCITPCLFLSCISDNTQGNFLVPYFPVSLFGFYCRRQDRISILFVSIPSCYSIIISLIEIFLIFSEYTYIRIS